MKLPTERTDEFRKRLNQQALEEDEEKPSSGVDSTSWFLGEQAHNKGSIHSDIWVGTAADLADRGVIGIYPVSGWWKDQPKRDRSQVGALYALVVSIDTDAQGVDIWTLVAIQIQVSAQEIELEANGDFCALPASIYKSLHGCIQILPAFDSETMERATKKAKSGGSAKSARAGKG